ncbi:DotU family type VI secretion system protein [Caldimonas brevitalea]|uniref:Type VI secretion system protein ImpK n=1 Tax=Caldimonas brevitalea TaxID=413882 RepID=A0A0G3BND8_9BURK|nr:DotU family type VI secretion system protein [Caldimonas brevitalea]AKJ28866.1 type VI secretion system protein ImpK [Caldimonas brevitalea]
MSPSHDPFAGFDNGKTFVMPTPGARPAGLPTGGGAGFTREAAQDIAYHPAGFNPLIAAANPLLNLIPQMRSITVHQDVAGLRDNLAQGIRQFEHTARAANIANEKVIAARYILCTVLDETAASTPWGGSGVWGRHSLLVMFHNEAWGGEKVFQLLTRLAQNPADNLDLLELIYTCITLGFEGRYRVIENGRSELQLLRERLAQLIRRQRGAFEQALAKNWAPAVLPKRKWATAMPLWIFGAVTALVLLGGYMGFSYALNRASDPLFASITGIRARAAALPAPVPAQKPRLAQFLAPEIQQGLVEVRDFDDRSIVTIRGDGLFEPGSATLESGREALMLRIADAVQSVTGLALVTGHTDNQPIRSARFPSNWHLSQERAKSVATLLGRRITDVSRLQAEGRADSEPVAPNDSANGRAKNRRVEITVFVTKPGA